MNTEEYRKARHLSRGSMRSMDAVLQRSNVRGLSRILDAHFMGSAEFEHGSISDTVSYLRGKDLQLKETAHKYVNGEHAPLYLIGTEVGIKRGEALLPSILSGEHKTSEWSGLLKGDRLATIRPDFWMDVTAHVFKKWDLAPLPEHSEPFILVAGKFKARRVFMELHHSPAFIAGDAEYGDDFHIGDRVYAAGSAHMGRIAGLMEDDTVVVKTFNHPSTYSSYDVWHVDAPCVQKIFPRPQAEDPVDERGISPNPENL